MPDNSTDHSLQKVASGPPFFFSNTPRLSDLAKGRKGQSRVQRENRAQGKNLCLGYVKSVLFSTLKEILPYQVKHPGTDWSQLIHQLMVGAFDQFDSSIEQLPS